MSEVTLIPYLQIRPSGLVAYSVFDKRGNRAHKRNTTFGGRQAYGGLMEKGTIRRLKRAVMILAACAKWKENKNMKTGKKFKWKVNFITLTLSAEQGEIKDQEIKRRILDPFIKRAARKYGLKSYVWRAEYQDNGNIHFHIMTDCWIHYKSLRRDWNKCQELLGFITRFEEKHGHRDPNSTDVHAVRKPRELAGYIAKYMIKQDPKNKPMGGRVWSASKNLLSFKFLTYEMDSYYEQIWNAADKQLWDKKIEIDFCSFIPLSDFFIKMLLPDREFNALLDWKEKIINPPEN